jgi:hypothetical protein
MWVLAKRTFGEQTRVRAALTPHCRFSMLAFESGSLRNPGPYRARAKPSQGSRRAEPATREGCLVDSFALPSVRQGSAGIEMHSVAQVNVAAPWPRELHSEKALRHAGYDAFIGQVGAAVDHSRDATVDPDHEA